MKCPNCNFKFTMIGNSKEEKGTPVLKCPKCSTTFELHSRKKMFPKGFLLLLLAIPFSFLPIEIIVIFIAVFIVPFLKWLFKPENIVINDEKNQNT